jgi:hypothetical protein
MSHLVPTGEIYYIGKCKHNTDLSESTVVHLSNVSNDRSTIQGRVANSYFSVPDFQKSSGSEKFACESSKLNLLIFKYCIWYDVPFWYYFLAGFGVMLTL